MYVWLDTYPRELTAARKTSYFVEGDSSVKVIVDMYSTLSVVYGSVNKSPERKIGAYVLEMTCDGRGGIVPE